MSEYKNLIFNEFNQDVWCFLKSSSLPILIYGMGNGADKIINVFENYGIEYKDVFASDGFVRGHSYRGKTVISYSQACEIYGNNFIIVVSFGSKLPDVINRIYELEKNHIVVCPDVPVCDGELFNEEFFDLHEKELFTARNLLSDDISIKVFDDIVRFKLTGMPKYLRSTSFDENDVDSILNLTEYKSYADLGAYNGDTIKKYTKICPNINTIYAFEPDSRNFRKLTTYCEEISDITTHLYNNAVCECEKTLVFASSGNRNSSGASKGSYQHKTVEIQGIAIDDVINEVDFIKYDVEGLESSALLGSTSIIKNCKPDLLVSMYHKSEDIYEIPILVNKLNPEYKLYLRRLPYIPAWDLNLYAKKS